MANGLAFGVENNYNYNAYQRWVRKASERSKLVSKILNIETKEQAAQHIYHMPFLIKRSEGQVSKPTDYINDFINQFA